MSGEPTYSGQTPDIHLFSPILFAQFKWAVICREISTSGTRCCLIVSISGGSLASCLGVHNDADANADADDAEADYGDDDDDGSSLRIFPSVFSTFATFVVNRSSLSSGLSGKARRKIFLNSFK